MSAVVGLPKYDIGQEMSCGHKCESIVDVCLRCEFPREKKQMDPAVRERIERDAFAAYRND